MQCFAVQCLAVYWSTGMSPRCHMLLVITSASTVFSAKMAVIFKFTEHAVSIILNRLELYI